MLKMGILLSRLLSPVKQPKYCSVQEMKFPECLSKLCSFLLDLVLRTTCKRIFTACTGRQAMLWKESCCYSDHRLVLAAKGSHINLHLERGQITLVVSKVHTSYS